MIGIAWSAVATASDPASASWNTTALRSPSARTVRMMRAATSPRFATRTVSKGHVARGTVRPRGGAGVRQVA